MSGISVLGFIGLIILVIYLFISGKRKKKERVEAIESGADVLESWKYSKPEWAKFEESQLNYWIKNTDHPGEVFITPTSVLITNGIDEFFCDFRENSKMVTHCSYRKSASILKFRLRWREYNSSREIYEFEKQDITIPLPDGNPEKAIHIVKYFNDIIDSNMDTVQGLMPGDSLTSLFFNDEF